MENGKGIEEAVNTAIAEINSNQVAEQTTPEIPDFALLTSHLADALLQTAQQQLIVAQNNLAQIEAYVAALRQTSAKEIERLTSLSSRLTRFSEQTLAAHEAFHQVQQ